QGFTTNFFLPLFNTRSDNYGGSFVNRARFSREVLEMVREEIGNDCAIALRFGLDTLPPPHGLAEGGVRAEEEGLRFVDFCDDLVDLWDIQLSWAGAWSEDAAPSRTHKENHSREYLRRVKDFTRKPVVNVGRFTSPDTMADVINSGQCDIIGAARPSIADPFLPKKIEEGRVEDIRECIGCNACISRWAIGGPAIVCTQNATVGEEFRRGWHPEIFSAAANRDSKVLIVGAGPAGLESAVVLAKREFSEIHIVEADTDVGGHLRWVSQLPGLQEWHRVVDYRQVQLEKLSNAVLITGKRLTEEDILNYGAEIVLIATGARWVNDGLNGWTQRPIPGLSTDTRTLTPEEVMSGADPGEKVLIYDTDGYFVGPSIAEYLARAGASVTFVTPFGDIGPQLDLTLEGPRMRQTLSDLRVRAFTQHVLTGVSADTGHLLPLSPFANESPDVDFDSIVFATQRLSNDSVYRSLKHDTVRLREHGVSDLHLIGDAYAPQHLVDTIFHAHRLSREIDSKDPSRPRPFIRERRLINGSDMDYKLDSSVLVPEEERLGQ
ncbi:MAG: FAD-dependent oxidoreductase, partial [Acidimicrobiia bacterium]